MNHCPQCFTLIRHSSGTCQSCREEVNATSPPQAPPDAASDISASASSASVSPHRAHLTGHAEDAENPLLSQGGSLNHLVVDEHSLMLRLLEEQRQDVIMLDTLVETLPWRKYALNNAPPANRPGPWSIFFSAMSALVIPAIFWVLWIHDLEDPGGSTPVLDARLTQPLLNNALEGRQR